MSSHRSPDCGIKRRFNWFISWWSRCSPDGSSRPSGSRTAPRIGDDDMVTPPPQPPPAALKFVAPRDGRARPPTGVPRARAATKGPRPPSRNHRKGWRAPAHLRAWATAGNDNFWRAAAQTQASARAQIGRRPRAQEAPRPQPQPSSRPCDGAPRDRRPETWPLAPRRAGQPKAPDLPVACLPARAPITAAHLARLRPLRLASAAPSSICATRRRPGHPTGAVGTSCLPIRRRGSRRPCCRRPRGRRP